MRKCRKCPFKYGRRLAAVSFPVKRALCPVVREKQRSRRDVVRVMLRL